MENALTAYNKLKRALDSGNLNNIPKIKLKNFLWL